MGSFDLTTLIFSIIGGLGLFIYGIHVMSEGMQKIAGDRLRTVLAKFTKNRFTGLLTGAGITSLIQSSSVMTVMVIGFINAGLMTFEGAIPVILGANIGTTVTAQLVAFKLTKYALPLVGIGSALYFFGRNRKQRNSGQAIFGFGAIFLGLNIMTSVVKPLAGSGTFNNIIVTFSTHPFLAIIVGMIATEIVQSSSVTTGIIVGLAATGIIDLRAAIPLILGTNIGTTITAVIASIKTTISAKRAAVAHVCFNVIGVAIAFALMPLYYFIAIHSSSSVARQVANTHTIFNVVNALIFLPFVPLYAKFIKKIVPGEDIVIHKGPKFLEKRLLATPSIALDAAKNELIRMLILTREAVEDAMNAYIKNDLKSAKKVAAKEDATDSLQESITKYLVELTQQEMSRELSEKIPPLLHSVNDVERVGDHAENIAEIAERKVEDKLKISKTAETELNRMYAALNSMFDNVTIALEKMDKNAAKKALSNENKINLLTVEIRNNHLQRVNKRICVPIAGVNFVDLVMNIEKIGDHLTNIAHAVLGDLSWNHNDKI